MSLFHTRAQSELRGSARISVIWLVTAVVLFLLSITMYFTTAGEVTDRDALLTQTRGELSKAKTDLLAEGGAHRDLTRVIGFYDPNNTADPRSNLETTKQALADFKSAFPDMGASVTDFEKAVPVAVAAYGRKTREAAEQAERIKTLENQIQSLNGTISSLTSEKDKLISGLNARLQDESANAAQREKELQARLERANAQSSDLDAEKRKLAKDRESADRTHRREVETYQARLDELKNITAFREAPFADLPDARVIEVSSSLGIGYVDIGTKQRLTRGTRFRIEGGAPGSRRVKGWAEVLEVEAQQSQVVFQELVDRFDPVVAGDVLINPLFDGQGERNAIMLGRFSGAYNEKDLVVLLERMGIHVQESLDLTTSFLIVGSEIYTDELGEPLEEPVQPSDLPLYKEAEALGVQIVPLADVKSYFKF